MTISQDCATGNVTAAYETAHIWIKTHFVNGIPEDLKRNSQWPCHKHISNNKQRPIIYKHG